MNLSSKSFHTIGIYLGLGLGIVMGLWFRLRFIHTVQPYPDEFVTLLAIQMIHEKGLPIMPSGLFYEHGLLFSYLGSVATFFGPLRLSVRYASLGCGLLTLGLTFLIGRRWFSRTVGMIATIGLAIAPTAIQWSGRARMYALLQLLILLFLWLSYEGIVQQKAKIRWWAMLVYLAAMLTHFVAVTLAPPLILAILILWWHRENCSIRQIPARLFQTKNWRRYILEGIGFLFVIGVAFLVKRAGQPKGVGTLEASNALPGLIQVLTIYSDLSWEPLAGWQAIAPFFLNLPALLFLPFALIAFYALISNQISNSKPILYLITILLATTLEMILLVSPDRRDDKYLFMILPVLLLLGGYGLTWFGDRLEEILGSWFSKIRGGVLIILLSLMLIFTYPEIQKLLDNIGDDYDTAFAYVQAHWQAGDKIMTGTPAAAMLYLGRNDFYAVQRRGGYDYRLLTLNNMKVDRWMASPAVRTETDLHQTLSEHDVWLVLERWGLQREYYDLPFQQQLLAQTEMVGESQGIFILRSKSDPQPIQLQPAHEIQANFDHQVELLGYTIRPEQVTPDQQLQITLYWQALQPMEYDYTVFIHLRHPEGGNVAQADHRPLGNLYPTTLWPVGEVIRERNADLIIPPDLAPGEYQLWTGLYRLETGERLSVVNDLSGENAVLLGTVTIEEAFKE